MARTSLEVHALYFCRQRIGNMAQMLAEPDFLISAKLTLRVLQFGRAASAKLRWLARQKKCIGDPPGRLTI